MQTDSDNIKELSLKEALQNLQQYIKYILSKWLIIGCIALVGAVIGITYAWLKAPQYQAVLTFSTDEEAGSSASGLLSLASQFGFSIGGSGNGIFSGENVLALMQSQTMIKNCLLTTVTNNGKQDKLINSYLTAEGWYKGFASSPILKDVAYPVTQDPAAYSRLQDSVLQLVITDIQENKITVDQPDKKYNVYQVSCTTKDEFFSKTFSELIIKEVSDFYVATKTKRSRETVDILQNRADSIMRAYNAALYGRAELTDANVNPALQLPLVNIQRKQTDITVLATAYGEILKNLELAKFNLLRETPLIQVIDSPMLPLKVVKPGRLLTGIIVAFIFGLLALLFFSVKYRLRD